MECYDLKKDRLIFLSEKATPDFWDKQWQVADLKKLAERNGRKDKLVAPVTERFLNPNKSVKILEGGCGMGHFVYSLNQRGFEAYGVDFAPQTVAKLQTAFPELNFSLGDVRKLDFTDNYFDGYWSLGVIEHFYDGYDSIAAEIRRVVKPGGYLFLTFPYISPFRRMKILLKSYPQFDSVNFDQNSFYQFALNHHQVVKDFQRLNFQLVYRRPIDGVNGLRQELPFLRPLMDRIYSGQFIAFKVIRFLINKLCSWFSGHIILLVLKNEKVV